VGVGRRFKALTDLPPPGQRESCLHAAR